jgi:DNA polymerase-3 subunit epsilon
VRFAAIDFETANSFIGSICAIGLAIVEDGCIVSRKYWLVKPHKKYNYFHPFNVTIHGITKDMVKDSDEFNTIYENELLPLLQDRIVIAHNAAFDMSALRHVLDVYGIDYPQIQYLCTYKAALKTWDHLENYKLDTVSRFLNFQFKHHNAEEDALACANILITILSKNRSNDIGQLSDNIGLKIGQLYSGGYSPCSVRSGKRTDCSSITPETVEFDIANDFYNKSVVFTGTLLSMPRREAMQKVVNAGGMISEILTEDTDFLIAGVQDHLKPGQESSKIKKAKMFIGKGRNIKIIDEKDFIRIIS